MFIVENRNAATAGAEDLDHLFEEFIARVQNGTALVSGIIPVFAHQQNAIDGQAIRPQGQGGGDVGIDLEIELLGSQGAQFLLVGGLIDIERDNAKGWIAVLSRVLVAQQKTVHRVLRMRAREIGTAQRGNGGQPGLPARIRPHAEGDPGRR